MLCVQDQEMASELFGLRPEPSRAAEDTGLQAECAACNSSRIAARCEQRAVSSQLHALRRTHSLARGGDSQCRDRVVFASRRSWSGQKGAACTYASTGGKTTSTRSCESTGYVQAHGACCGNDYSTHGLCSPSAGCYSLVDKCRALWRQSVATPLERVATLNRRRSSTRAPATWWRRRRWRRWRWASGSSPRATRATSSSAPSATASSTRRPCRRAASLGSLSGAYAAVPSRRQCRVAAHSCLRPEPTLSFSARAARLLPCTRGPFHTAPLHTKTSKTCVTSCCTLLSQFSENLLHSDSHDPAPLTADERYQLSWEAGTERRVLGITVPVLPRLSGHGMIGVDKCLALGVLPRGPRDLGTFRAVQFPVRRSQSTPYVAS